MLFHSVGKGNDTRCNYVSFYFFILIIVLVFLINPVRIISNGVFTARYKNSLMFCATPVVFCEPGISVTKDNHTKLKPYTVFNMHS
jgi:hypothetical protein